jgi:hypothetical protein
VFEKVMWRVQLSRQWMSLSTLFECLESDKFEVGIILKGSPKVVELWVHCLMTTLYRC